ncbi:uncharacterized protein B0I36DRAFT_431906 [Microdochium trichocladiopsis]|uniref:CFEM domain-containing protein n=1 Tax=Microdochium trichocladiopsis TaxID=1682393 RepID=A0A9P8Y3N2_9PEZI|nr:uncharacterized protein B0I36DRAFT_431906 [Microdochium trichocladiopsis]KAH7028997.1 hypothetical protein B0I36DRAFT_431906 [Microdochium trichocladiopsis]
MQFKLAALPLLAALAAAQTTADNNTSTSNESLAELISQLPQCARGCFTSAAERAGCATTDFECICIDNRPAFIAAIAPCVFLSTCQPSETSAATNVATDFCHKIYASPNDTELAAASSAVTAVLGTPAPTQSSDPNSAAARPVIGLGLLGAAVMAAVAF